MYADSFCSGVALTSPSSDPPLAEVEADGAGELAIALLPCEDLEDDGAEVGTLLLAPC